MWVRVCSLTTRTFGSTFKKLVAARREGRVRFSATRREIWDSSRETIRAINYGQQFCTFRLSVRGAFQLPVATNLLPFD